MPVQLKPSAAANTFVKALETYVTDDQEFQMVGFELSLLLDPRQHRRLMILLDSYQGGRKARGL